MNNVEMVRTDLLIAMQISLLLGQNICCWQLRYRDTQATTTVSMTTHNGGLLLAAKKSRTCRYTRATADYSSGSQLIRYLPLESVIVCKRPTVPPTLSDRDLRPFGPERQEIIDPAIGPDGQFLQGIPQPGLRIQSVQLGRPQQALNRGGPLPGAL